MENSIKIINNANWHDFSFEKLELDYDEAKIEVSEDEIDSLVEIVASGYIGLSCLAHWDENIIRDINVEKGSKLTEKSLSMIRENYGNILRDGGGYKKIDGDWYELEIEFIDNNKLVIICQQLSINIKTGMFIPE